MSCVFDVTDARYEVPTAYSAFRISLFGYIALLADGLIQIVPKIDVHMAPDDRQGSVIRKIKKSKSYSF